MAYGAGLPGFGAGRGAGFGAGAGGRYGAGTGVGYGAGLAGAWLPTDLGSLLAAWYKADAGCYTDAACLFASASSQYLARASEAALVTGDVSSTVAFFAYMDSTSRAFIAGKGDGSGLTDEWWVEWNGSSKFLIGVTNGSGNVKATTAGAYSTGTWYFIVAAFDKATGKCSINVNDVGAVLSAALTGARSSDSTAFGIGAEGGYAGLYANGRIGRFGFWKRTLTAAEQTWLYNAGAGRFYADLGVAGTDGSALKTSLVEYWNLCESSSTRVGSHAGLNLTPTNGPTVAAGPGEGACVNNSPRKRIADQSGNARHRTQATIGKQPLYLDAIQNGRAVGRYDGTDDFDQILSNLGALPITIFGAVKSPNSGVSAVWEGGSLLSRLGLLRINTDQAAFCGSSVAAAHTAGAFHVYETAFDSSSSTTLTIDGVDVATGDSGDPDGSVGFTVGALPDGAAPSAMDDGEVFIVVGAMTAAQKASARAYLKQRWGTP